MKIGGLLKLISMTALLAVLMGCAATEEGDPPDPSYDVLMDSAKAALETGDGYQAYIWFCEANRLRPMDSQANLGIMLSDLTQLLNLVDQFIYFGGEMAQTAPPEDETQLYAKQWDDVEMGAGDQIDALVMQIFDERLEEMVVAGQVAKVDPAMLFTISAIPLNFQGEEILSLPGNWDSADVHFFLAVGRAIQSVMDIFLSMDLNFDFGLVMDLLATDFSVLETSQVIDLVVDVFYTMLTDADNPDFLLGNDEAATRMPKSGLNLAMAAEEIITAFDTLYDPAGPLGYVETIDNGVHDPSELYVIGNMAPMSAEMTALMPELLDVLEQARMSLLDGTEFDVDPSLPNTFDLSSLNVILKGFGVPELLSIPSYPVDLGAVFNDPHPEELKDTLTSLLGCLHNSAALIPTVVCIVESL
jgi:hypothetical protein